MKLKLSLIRSSAVHSPNKDNVFWAPSGALGVTILVRPSVLSYSPSLSIFFSLAQISFSYLRSLLGLRSLYVLSQLFPSSLS